MPQTDITFKELFGRDAQPLLELLLPAGAGPLQVVELNPELPATLRRIDLLLRGVCRVRPGGTSCDRLLALDWQVQTDPELPATMFLRAALAFYKHRVRVTTLLLAATAAAAIETQLIWAEHGSGEVDHDEARERLIDFATTFATLELSKEAASAFVQAARRRSQIMLDLRQSGYAQMLLAEGEVKGEVKGEARGQARAILAILEARHAPLSDAMRRKLMGCDDLSLLQQWLMLAIGGQDAELRQQVAERGVKAA